MKSQQKVFIKTFGCQMNSYDSTRIIDLLSAKQAMQLTEDETQADLILLNTCSIREKAEEKVFSQLGRFAKLKKKNPALLIGVGGCVASQEGENILKRAPYVDLVFGPQTLHRLPQMIDQKRSSQLPQVDISFPEIEKFDHLPPPRLEGSQAFVSIMEGCSKYCSFCIVPYTRGEEVSRPLEAILVEIAHLIKQGVQEITLLGQNVNAYKSETADKASADLALLIEYIAGFPEIKRIRFTTSHPNEMTPSLIACFKNIPKLAKHLHLPIQSGSDRILMAMKRNYTAIQYKSIIKNLRQICPEISITSDFIVGFPGETAQDFENTLNLMEKLHFDYSFSFLYSARPGTPASYLVDDISVTEKSARLSQLKKLNEQQGYQISQNMIGTTQRILVDGISQKLSTHLSGKTDNMRTVDFIGNAKDIGQFINVRITDASNPYRLQGEVLA